MDCVYPIKQSESTGLFGYDKADGCFGPEVFRYKDRRSASMARNVDPDVVLAAAQIRTTGTVYSIPKNSIQCNRGYSIARTDCERDIRFDPDMIYAVVRASCYGEKGYTTHKTETSAIAESKRESASRYIHDIIDRSGTGYKIVIDGNQEHLVAIPENTPSDSLTEYKNILVRTKERKDIHLHAIARELLSTMAAYEHRTTGTFTLFLILAEAERQIKDIVK